MKLIKKMYYKILPSKRSKLSTISDIELFDYLDKFNKNLIRWGDGETNIALGFPNIFQESNQQLKQTLNEIVMNYSEKSPYILALPTKFIDSKNSNLTLKEKNTWSKTNYLFSEAAPAQKVYANHFKRRTNVCRVKFVAQPKTPRAFIHHL